MPAPTYLGIGAMKCGTTSIADFLMNHPSAGFIRGKEAHWFNRFRARGVSQEDYENIFPNLPQRGEFTPLYENHIDEIADLYPRAKLIYAVRNPIDRLRSEIAFAQYWSPMRNGPEIFSKRGDGAFPGYLTIPSIQAAIEDETIAGHILRRGLYMDTIRRIRARKMSVLVVDFAELRDRQGEVQRKLCDYLDLPPLDATPLHSHPTRTEWPDITSEQRDWLATYYWRSNLFMLSEFGIDLFKASS